jgi:hypothetical protein
MGFRFRKSIKLMPGVRLNVSSRGVSTSIGGKGGTLNVSRRGVRGTASIPGSGISYTKTASFQRAPTRSTGGNVAMSVAPGDADGQRSVGFLLGLGILLVPLLFAWFTLRTGHSRLSRVVAFGWLGAVLLLPLLEKAGK